ncbi:MAG TPA: hypothetical protein VF723_02720, partial [Pyrinomonadaceae bacterium]
MRSRSSRGHRIPIISDGFICKQGVRQENPKFNPRRRINRMSEETREELDKELKDEDKRANDDQGGSSR